jgi:hypothetical protein
MIEVWVLAVMLYWREVSIAFDPRPFYTQVACESAARELNEKKPPDFHIRTVCIKQE